MPIKLSFLGGASDVTGARYLLEANNIRFLVDCGMCNGGRVKHHLVTNISRPESTILFVGYQAIGTLGRQIMDGAKKVRILGQHYPVRAKIVQINGFSAHADRNELSHWLSNLNSAPRQVFVTHGEPKAARHFSQFLKEKTGREISVPEYRTKKFLE
ncbi:MBL fold metallo-hydrolase RNA specificity domain-containing protein [Chloroflexota bacterium]